jgi:hypothetical protein
MRRLLSVALFVAAAAPALAQKVESEDGHRASMFRTRERHEVDFATPRGGHTNNLTYHGGPTITSARVVSIFWGPSSVWGTQSSPSPLASTLLAFVANFGTTGEYNVITQYSGIQLSGLGNENWVDNSTPPTNVTDAILQSEVQAILDAHHGGIADPSTIYHVFLPPGSYSSFGTSTSCGGPHLVYCAYHSSFSYNGVDVKYGSLPYPSCSGCQWPGWSDAENFEHFICHETREAVTDPDGNAWFDKQGNEADDKCAWSPAPFLDGGFGYQYEWSNAARGCVQKR